MITHITVEEAAKLISRIARINETHALTYIREAADRGEIQAADVAPVVYCKDCVYLGRSDFYGECSCGLLGVVGPTDYCSRGARRNKEAVHET